MNAKERFYSGLAKETIGKITSNTDNWTSFLRTMSRNYEFTYPEQVMIYAQRPNATFCKPYEDWNAENYRRYVKRGSTGIALFVMNRDKPYLRYVFDVADTGVRRSSPELKPWEVTPETAPMSWKRWSVPSVLPLTGCWKHNLKILHLYWRLSIGTITKAVPRHRCQQLP